MQRRQILERALPGVDIKKPTAVSTVVGQDPGETPGGQACRPGLRPARDSIYLL